MRELWEMLKVRKVINGDLMDISGLKKIDKVDIQETMRNHFLT